MEEEKGIKYQMDGFFPSLSDSSYLSLDDSMESIDKLKKNFPQMDELYPLPLEQIKKLNIKAVDFGVYGKDAHKSTERLQVPYSFGILPELILKTTEEFLNVC
ncbi:MAG: peptidase M20, partial [Pseudobutyrivibrio sp.]|nr:peptidase M20 [Pseudobutyrivibrio sp.]